MYVEPICSSDFDGFSPSPPSVNISNVLFTLVLEFILQTVAEEIFERWISDPITPLLKMLSGVPEPSRGLQGCARGLQGYCPPLWSLLSAMLPSIFSPYSVARCSFVTADLPACFCLERDHLPPSLVSLANPPPPSDVHLSIPSTSKTSLMFQNNSYPSIMCSVPCHLSPHITVRINCRCNYFLEACLLFLERKLLWILGLCLFCFSPISSIWKSMRAWHTKERWLRMIQ